MTAPENYVPFDTVKETNVSNVLWRRVAAGVAGAALALGAAGCNREPDSPCGITFTADQFADAPFVASGKIGDQPKWLSISHPVPGVEMKNEKGLSSKNLALIVFGDPAYLGQKSKTLLSLTHPSQAEVTFDGVTLTVDYTGKVLSTACTIDDAK
jgi:hypothetical protein